MVISLRRHALLLTAAAVLTAGATGCGGGGPGELMPVGVVKTTPAPSAPPTVPTTPAPMHILTTPTPAPRSIPPATPPVPAARRADAVCAAAVDAYHNQEPRPSETSDPVVLQIKADRILTAVGTTLRTNGADLVGAAAEAQALAGDRLAAAMDRGTAARAEQAAYAVAGRRTKAAAEEIGARACVRLGDL